MRRACFFCRSTTPDRACYVRVGREERSSCRFCWEQVVLRPDGFLRQMLDSHHELQAILGTARSA